MTTAWYIQVGLSVGIMMGIIGVVINIITTVDEVEWTFLPEKYRSKLRLLITVLALTAWIWLPWGLYGLDSLSWSELLPPIYRQTFPVER